LQYDVIQTSHIVFFAVICSLRTCMHGAGHPSRSSSPTIKKPPINQLISGNMAHIKTEKRGNQRTDENEHVRNIAI